MISFTDYLKQLCLFVFSSSLVLALSLGMSLLVAGEASMNLDLDLDFGAFDGLGVMVGLPLLSLLLFAILSPLSFSVFRLLSRKNRLTALENIER